MINVAERFVKPVLYTIVQIRNYFYTHGIFRTVEVSVPVVSIGNISFGGTGKTPLVIWIAQELQKAGFQPVILSRGYKRKSFFTKIVSDTKKVRIGRRRAGDEPYLMANKLKGVPVVVSRKRVKGASKAIKQFKPDVILLDDGFQHRKIARHVDIVLIDSPETLNGAKLTREPLKNLRRADVVVFTKYDSYNNAPEILERMVKTFSCPVFRSGYKSVSIRNDTSSFQHRYLTRRQYGSLQALGNRTISSIRLKMPAHM